MWVGIITLSVVTLVIIFLLFGFYRLIFGDAPFVPTPFHAVHKLLKSAKIKKGDKVFDLGAGDGRFVHFAEKDYEANATGFEIDPFVFALAKLRQLFFRWKGTMLRKNFSKIDLSEADIIICYMMPKALKKYQKKFEKELKKEAKIVSYTFKVGTLKPLKTIPKSRGINKILIYKL